MLRFNYIIYSTYSCLGEPLFQLVKPPIRPFLRVLWRQQARKRAEWLEKKSIFMLFLNKTYITF